MTLDAATTPENTLILVEEREESHPSTDEMALEAAPTPENTLILFEEREEIYPSEDEMTLDAAPTPESMLILLEEQEEIHSSEDEMTLHAAPTPEIMLNLVEEREESHPSEDEMTLLGSKEAADAPNRLERLGAEDADRKLEMTIEVRFDGGSRGNPGLAGAGVELLSKWSIAGATRGQKILIRKCIRKKSTNNQAEFQGAVIGLEETIKLVKECQKQYSVDSTNRCHVTLLLQGDSQLVIKQLDGEYKVKSPNIKPLYAKSQKLLSELHKLASTNVTFEHIYRKCNAVAGGECGMEVAQSITHLLSNISNFFLLTHRFGKRSNGQPTQLGYNCR
jgi:ribonuclease HI